jgi:hypothetical protein
MLWRGLDIARAEPALAPAVGLEHARERRRFGMLRNATWTSEAAMQLSSRTICTAGVVSAALMLQGASELRPNLAPPTSSMARPERWTTQNVTGERPFGTIDVTPAGSSVQSVRLWTLGRSVLERYEINGRCAVITTPENAARYSESDQQFCRNYAMAGFARSVPRS